MNHVDLLFDLADLRKRLDMAVAAMAVEPVRVSVQTQAPRSGQARGRQLTDDEAEALIAAFVSGTPRWELAEEYKINIRTVGRLLQRRGVRMRPTYRRSPR